MHYRIEFFADRREKWRFRLKAPNGEIMLSSQAYASKYGAQEGFRSLASFFGAIKIEDSFSAAHPMKENKIYYVGQLDERVEVSDDAVEVSDDAVEPVGNLDDTEAGTD